MQAIAMREAYGRLLVELAGQNEKIVVLDADMAQSCGLQHFRDAFPDRFFNIGIAEQNMMGIAAGLAAYGKIPFVNSFACFLSTRSCDQLRVAVAYGKLNVKIVAGHGGISVGEDGATHQGLEDIAIVRAIPNMVLIVPADPVETAAAVRAAIEYDGPVYIRLARPKVKALFDDSYKFQIGKAVTMKEGKDASLLAIGIMVSRALEAAQLLEKRGLNVNVINVSTIKPLDRETIVRAVEQTGLIVTLEDHSVIGGLGSAVAEVLAEEDKPVIMRRLGIPDVFGESGTFEELLAKYGLTVPDIVKVVAELVQKKRDSK